MEDRFYSHFIGHSGGMGKVGFLTASHLGFKLWPFVQAHHQWCSSEYHFPHLPQERAFSSKKKRWAGKDWTLTDPS